MKIMKKLNRKFGVNLLFIIISLSIFIGTHCIAKAEDLPPGAPLPKAEQIQPQAQKPPTSIPQKNLQNITHMKQSGFKYTILKFFAAMGGVLLSAAAIFIGLKIYKKLLMHNNTKLDKIDYNKTLESPKDFKEAINLFLEKTDK